MKEIICKNCKYSHYRKYKNGYEVWFCYNKNSDLFGVPQWTPPELEPKQSCKNYNDAIQLTLF